MTAQRISSVVRSPPATTEVSYLEKLTLASTRERVQRDTSTTTPQQTTPQGTYILYSTKTRPALTESTWMKKKNTNILESSPDYTSDSRFCVVSYVLMDRIIFALRYLSNSTSLCVPDGRQVLLLLGCWCALGCCCIPSVYRIDNWRSTSHLFIGGGWCVVDEFNNRNVNHFSEEKVLRCVCVCCVVRD